MKFITLTRHDGQSVLVNPDHIDALILYDGFTEVVFAGGKSIDVTEDVQMILAQG